MPNLEFDFLIALCFAVVGIGFSPEVGVIYAAF